jgi:hypothetical protein
MTLCLALGFWLRSHGYFYDVSAMGLDETTWAMMLMDLPLRELLIRPPGFMAVSKVLALLFGPTEGALRFLPWLAAIVGLALSPFIAQRLFRAPSARVLFVAIIALHPGLTDLAKEFKPYSVSLAFHMALLFLALRSLSTRALGDLGLLLGVAAVGVLFTQDLVFALPGIFALVGWDAFKNDKRRVSVIALAALVIITTLLLQYFLIWKNLPKGESDYWGSKYDVFHVPSSGVSYPSWLLSRYSEVVTLPGYERKYWRAPPFSEDEWYRLKDVAAVIWGVLHVVGLLTLAVNRRFRDAVLLCAPLVALVVFNRFGFWPLGTFRTNTFLLVYYGGIAAMALDGARAKAHPVGDILPASLLVVFPLLFFESSFPPPTKRAFTRTSAFPDLVAWLASQPAKARGAPKPVVVLAHGTCDPWRYFIGYHPKTRHLKKKLERNFEARCVDDSDAIAGELRRGIAKTSGSVWLVRGREQTFGRQSDLRTVQSARFDRHVASELVANAAARAP